MIAADPNVIGFAVFIGVALGAGIVLLTLYMIGGRR